MDIFKRQTCEKYRRASQSYPTESVENSRRVMLCKKAIDAPIPTGGMIRGVLWFHLPGVRPEEINKRDCHLVLRARDAFGKDIAVAVTFGPFDKKVPVVFAGLNVPSTQIDLAGPIPQVLA